MTRAVRVLWLTTIWVALWSDVSIANVLSGLVVAAMIVASFDTWHAGRPIFRPVAAVKFAVYFVYQLAVSTVVVARTVITPRHTIRSGIIAVPLHGCSDAVVTLIADAISLTPGTLTLEVRRDPLTLYVHVLDVRDVDVIRRELRHLEVLAIKTFGDADAITGLATDDSTFWRGR